MHYIFRPSKDNSTAYFSIVPTVFTGWPGYHNWIICLPAFATPFWWLCMLLKSAERYVLYNCLLLHYIVLLSLSVHACVRPPPCNADFVTLGHHRELQFCPLEGTRLRSCSSSVGIMCWNSEVSAQFTLIHVNELLHGSPFLHRYLQHCVCSFFFVALIY